MEQEWQTDWKEPVVIVPKTAHYSWFRAASLLGIGKKNLVRVDVDEEFSMVPSALDAVLNDCLQHKRPIWQIVTVVGTTEFGSVDPVHEIVGVRDGFAKRGLYAPIHVDGAYGGYFATMFAKGASSAESDADQSSFAETTSQDTQPALGYHFASEPWLRDAFHGIRGADSITVDPHKAGYTPYGAGAIVLKHGFLKDLVAETAPYCLDREDTTQVGSSSPQLGKFILEGSKPGAVAAAVWFSHRLIPLNQDGYGRQLSILCRIARVFDQLVSQRSNVFSLFRPHTNIVGLMARKAGITRKSQLNDLNEHLAVRFGVQEVSSIQSYDYLISRTTIAPDSACVSSDVYLNTLTDDVEQLTILRLVFMNRWVEGKDFAGQTYLKDFLDTLEKEVTDYVVAVD